MKVELALFDYAKKADLKKAAVVNTSNFAKNIYLARLKSNVDILR